MLSFVILFINNPLILNVCPSYKPVNGVTLLPMGENPAPPSQEELVVASISAVCFKNHIPSTIILCNPK